MLRTALTSFLFLTAAPAIAACTGPAFYDQLPVSQQVEITNAAAATPYGEGLFWTATKDDTTLTLLGTFHAYDPRIAPILDRIRPTLRTADLLMVEAPPKEQAAMQAALAADPNLYLINAGPTLPDLLPPDDWATVSRAAKDRGMPAFFVAKMQPWYLSLILAIPACAFADITSGPPGLDKRLVSEAMDQGVPVARLEPWRTVIDIMTNWTIDEQIKLLEFGLFDAQDQTALHIGGLNHYFAGRTALAWEARRIALRNLSDMTEAEVDAELKETQDFILTQRNQNWIPVIEDAAKTHDDILIAFGAAHLPGDQGVLNLLAQAGWTVQRAE